MTEILPTLLDGASTRDTLHRYSKIAGAVCRSLSQPHPLWWNISLSIYPDGLTTTPIEVQSTTSSALEIRLNLRRHRLEVIYGAESREVDLTAGLTATDLGDRTVGLIRDFGLEGEIDRGLYTSEATSPYEIKAAEEYLCTVARIEKCLSDSALEIGGDTGPVQLWPHHFDLSFEWFGTRIVQTEEGSEIDGARPQIGFGFSLGDSSITQPYFYATPWPFDSQVAVHPLPDGATWHQDSWQGALLLYDTVRKAGEASLVDFVRSVHSIASPGLGS